MHTNKKNKAVEVIPAAWQRLDAAKLRAISLENIDIYEAGIKSSYIKTPTDDVVDDEGDGGFWTSDGKYHYWPDEPEEKFKMAAAIRLVDTRDIDWFSYITRDNGVAATARRITSLITEQNNNNIPAGQLIYVTKKSDLSTVTDALTEHPFTIVKLVKQKVVNDMLRDVFIHVKGNLFETDFYSELASLVSLEASFQLTNATWDKLKGLGVVTN